MRRSRGSRQHHTSPWPWVHLPRWLLRSRTSGQKGPRSCRGLRREGPVAVSRGSGEARLLFRAAASAEHPPEPREHPGPWRAPAARARPPSRSTVARLRPRWRPSRRGEAPPRPPPCHAAAPHGYLLQPHGEPGARPALRDGDALGTDERAESLIVRIWLGSQMIGSLL